MTNVESLERQVKALTPEELAEFRAWFQEFDQDEWDTQIERDVRSGRLDELAARALEQDAAGTTSPL